ncbi:MULTISPECIES: hypothetical protein [Pseudomonas]|jgi:hypothetical protein|uniref:hypothetical protein n=1 Tax=Pseudomonas TaxID=286 RepID=UPI0015A4754B|nr:MULTISPECIES: hypothetical protein [Pseudomonas]MCO7625013.1 ATP-binding protein [Pseudomonas fluorescens]NWD63992.1 hypothetical protein [Pseudomonas sp. IPO3774]
MSDYEPHDTKARDLLMNSHPLVLGKYLVVTPTINWAYDQISEQVWLRMPSVYFQSLSRMGKTQCATAIVKFLREEFPERYILFLTVDVTGEENIIQTMVKAMKLETRVKEKLSNLRDAVMNHIICELASLGDTHFILVVDEMQALTYKDLQHLQVIQNRLSLSEVQLTTIGFAQEQIKGLITSLHKGRHMALLGRFFSRKVEFVGCVSADWLKETLSAFDQDMTYPRGSGCSYTRFFLPKAFDSGFRLDSLAELIFSESIEHIKSVGASLIPTENMFLALAYLLISARDDDADGFELTKEHVIKSIVKSDMQQVSALMGDKLPTGYE